MKAINIENPDQLRDLALCARSDETRLAMMRFAAAWNGRLNREPGAKVPFTVTLELSRSATAYNTNRNGDRKYFGALKLTAAREFAAAHGQGSVAK